MNQITYLVDGDTVCVVVGAAMGKLVHALDGDLVQYVKETFNRHINK